MKKLFLIIPFLFLGCAPYHHGNWAGNACITPGFTDDQNDMIYRSTQEWHNRSNDNVNLGVSFLNNHEENGCDVVISAVDPAGPPVGITESPPYKGGAAVIYIDPLLPTENNNVLDDTSNDFYHVTLHEVGHYLGTEHSPYCNDVMYWKINGTYHLSDNDVDQLWNPYPDGKYDNLNYCLVGDVKYEQ